MSQFEDTYFRDPVNEVRPERSFIREVRESGYGNEKSQEQLSGRFHCHGRIVGYDGGKEGDART